MTTNSAYLGESDSDYKAVVVGASAGGGAAIAAILSVLSRGFPLPIFVAQHLHPSDDESFAQHISRCTNLKVVVPCDKQPVEPGCVYVAPANYHMLIERNGTVALSTDERVNWSRPSIDVLFESAAYAFSHELVAVILTGASRDGALGMRIVKQHGGLGIVQSPESAESPAMPRAAIDQSAPDYIEPPEHIAKILGELGARLTTRRRSNGE